MTNQQFWWHLARASGIVTWGLLTASALWGVLLATRLLKPYDRPAWLLDLHKWLGTLTIMGTALHMGAIVGDSYVHFGTADVFIPFASDWKTTGVAWGIIGFYMLVTVQVSSWIMKKIPKPLWRSIHYLSYALFVVVSLHSITAGTDRSNTLFQALAVALITLMVAATSIRILYTGKPKTRDVLGAARSSAAAKPSSPLPPPPPPKL